MHSQLSTQDDRSRPNTSPSMLAHTPLARLAGVAPPPATLQTGLPPLYFQHEGECASLQIGLPPLFFQHKGECASLQTGLPPLYFQHEGECASLQINLPPLFFQLKGECASLQTGLQSLNFQHQGSVYPYKQPSIPYCVTRVNLWWRMTLLGTGDVPFMSLG
jgi:hypothetical protein